MPIHRLVVMVLLLAAAAFAEAAGDSIVMLERAEKSRLLYLLTTPENGTPKVGAILFTGGEGMVGLARGIPHPGANFLVRSRALFGEHGIATAIFDPSADSGPLSDRVRMSELHATEVEQVLTDFKNRLQLDQVYLIGTSRGTVSAAYVGVRLGDKINGVVLTSTIFVGNRGGGPGLSTFDYGKIQVPLLFVHHRNDTCRVTPPFGAENMRGRFPVMLIDGGEASGDPCGPYNAHGYQGREKEAVAAISDWILTPRQTARIHLSSP